MKQKLAMIVTLVAFNALALTGESPASTLKTECTQNFILYFIRGAQGETVVQKLTKAFDDQLNNVLKNHYKVDKSYRTVIYNPHYKGEEDLDKTFIKVVTSAQGGKNLERTFTGVFNKALTWYTDKTGYCTLRINPSGGTLSEDDRSNYSEVKPKKGSEISVAITNVVPEVRLFKVGEEFKP